MADSFDPYREWLGVEGPRPLDYYRLLGLNRFESNLDLIAKAADVAMARVRGVRPGAHAAHWSRVLDQLGAAKKCLLDPKTRTLYDDRLRAKPTAGQPTKPAQPAKAVQPAKPQPTKPVQPAKPAQPQLGAPLISNDLMAEFAAAEATPMPMAPIAPTSSSSDMKPLVIGLIAVAVVVVGIFVFVVCRRSTSPVTPALASVQPTSGQSTVSAPAPPPPAPSRPASPSPPQPPVQNSASADKPVGPMVGFGPPPSETESPAPPAQEKKAKSEESSLEHSTAEAEKPKPVSDSSEPDKRKPAPEPPMSRAFVRAVADVRSALAGRDLAAASKHLKTATDETQNPMNREQVERLETMLDNLTQFWDGIRALMGKLQAAEEIAIKDTRVVVIESDRNHLNVKAEGRIHRFKIETMPASLVMALVERNFGRDAGSKAVIATFLAVDPKGDRALAKRYWQEAASEGLDTERLIPEIDAMPPVVRPAASKSKGNVN